MRRVDLLPSLHRRMRDDASYSTSRVMRVEPRRPTGERDGMMLTDEVGDRRIGNWERIAMGERVRLERISGRLGQHT